MLVLVFVLKLNLTDKWDSPASHTVHIKRYKHWSLIDMPQHVRMQRCPISNWHSRKAISANSRPKLVRPGHYRCPLVEKCMNQSSRFSDLDPCKTKKCQTQTWPGNRPDPRLGSDLWRPLLVTGRLHHLLLQRVWWMNWDKADVFIKLHQSCCGNKSWFPPGPNET